MVLQNSFTKKMSCLDEKSINMFLIREHFPNPKLIVLHEVYPPQTDTGKEMLQHAAKESWDCHQGTLQIAIADKARTLKKGDAYYFSNNLLHRFKNTGKY